jgi:hypothetical protein
MRKIVVLILAALLIAMTISCNNPNKSPTDKVGGYHVGYAAVRVDGLLI